MEIFLAILTVLVSYLLKGFSGFGPALIMVPIFSMIYDPGTAIVTTALLDFLAGLSLAYSVRKDIQWKFVIPIFSLFGLGALAGSYLLGSVSEVLLKKFIGLLILCFSAVIIFVRENGRDTGGKRKKLTGYGVGFLSGFLGGFLGISGPPLIIYMKLYYQKILFRAQLIAIFLLGAGWRFLLYRLNNIRMEISPEMLLIFAFVMAASIWTGSHLHFKTNERLFNKIIAAVLLLPALNLLIS